MRSLNKRQEDKVIKIQKYSKNICNHKKIVFQFSGRETKTKFRKKEQIHQ